MKISGYQRIFSGQTKVFIFNMFSIGKIVQMIIYVQFLNLIKSLFRICMLKVTFILIKAVFQRENLKKVFNQKKIHNFLILKLFCLYSQLIKKSTLSSLNLNKELQVLQLIYLLKQINRKNYFFMQFQVKKKIKLFLQEKVQMIGMKTHLIQKTYNQIKQEQNQKQILNLIKQIPIHFMHYLCLEKIALKLNSNKFNLQKIKLKQIVFGVIQKYNQIFKNLRIKY
ncbi:hypothetical protein IMG5_000890 [Ichthyophthirius multifiliis]|uniref:Transmembrane protein n=1 Tax=Ichthyophthirius multifiliis TaxID=5932 RepID=G0QIX6_ICHMU|nr:hypothetical protein IMG5_000890 [Ichthyophthirius multifiliis]EGR34861.1 hypothetical protein IMG5_000890 [Ichthyophthirius multifiliis]|eukprot:XP_004040165.1 hypothetical protein IMG5_000890 [Ichthyophthirius multifiliis]